VEDSGGLNGTYAWNIISVENSYGGTIVTVNETFRGSTHWSHVGVYDGNFEYTIPPGGKIAEITASEGAIGDLILWLGTYYNHLLLDRTAFIRKSCMYYGMGEEKTSVQGTERAAINVYPGLAPTSARYDRASGILLRYYYGSKLGHYEVSLNSTNILGSVNVADENSSKSVIDLLLVVPLFVLPFVGALIGLNSIRKRGVGYSMNFWKLFVLLNGVLIALLSNYPIEIPHFVIPYDPWVPFALIFNVGGRVLNVGFWSGLLFAAVLIINRFVFPIIKRDAVTLEE
jgi:hypothetical protein